MNARFRGLAEQQQITESALAKQLVVAAVRRDANIDADVLTSSGRRLRAAPTWSRLHPDDTLILSEWAASRQMRGATYLSVLVRAHPLKRQQVTTLRARAAPAEEWRARIEEVRTARRLRLLRPSGKRSGESKVFLLNATVNR